MEKEYKNRALKKPEKDRQMRTFFFPKENPPVSVEAENLEEALEILKTNKKAK